MALIKCSECGKEVSDKASICPNCGCPIESMYANIVHKGDSSQLDRFSPSIIIEHLSYAKQLEVYKYTMQTTIAKLQAKISTLGMHNSFPQPKSKAGERIGNFWIGFWIALIPAVLIALFISGGQGFSGFIQNIVCVLTVVLLFFNGELMGHIFMAIGAAAVVGLLVMTISLIGAKRDYNREMKVYRNNIINDQNRVAIEKNQIIELKQQQSILQANIQKNEAVLQKLYGLNIIHNNYRNMIAVIRILEYFDSGRCTSLTGHEGAYNMFNDEMLHEKIISKLEVAISLLDEIRNTQYMLYDAIQSSNAMAERMYRQTESLLELNQNIARNTEIAAYNSKIAADNSRISAYIDVFSY